MNIKYTLLVNKNTQQKAFPLLTFGKWKSERKLNLKKPIVLDSETTSISVNPSITCDMREKMDQNILVQGIEGLKIGLSGRVRIGNSRFGYAWKP